MATPRMDERWYRIRDRIKDVYDSADITDKEMRRARGNLPKMVNLIHDKTGEPPAEIRRTVMALM
jgi:hypothetical protein